MARALTQKQFLKKAIELHGTLYDYSRINYTNTRTNIAIICEEHGLFLQSPKAHLKGKGCPKCGRLSAIEKLVSNTELFIKKSKLIHGDLYDYNLVIYTRAKKSVIIICREHGEFVQVAHTHLEGSGCPKCGRMFGTINCGVAPNRPTILYYFRHIKTDTYKIGITSTSYDKRYNRKLRNGQQLLWFSEIMPREDAEELEEFLLDEFKEFRVFNYHYKNNGGTEFFSKNVLNKRGVEDGS